jgi:hypothetical protein
LPLMMMRKQKLVDRLADGGRLDPQVLGVPLAGPVKWKLFYDVDDILAFPARGLYERSTTIEEFQVDTNWRPDLSHGAYWTNATVLREMVDLIRSNLV